MKTRIRHLCVLLAFGSLAAIQELEAQTFTTLASFNGSNGDEYYGAPTPIQIWGDPLVLSTDGNFYGTTPAGGTNGNGVVFKVTPTGVLTKLHDFSESTNTDFGVFNTDGFVPNGLAQGNDGNFYGTTWNGGLNGGGTIFMIAPDGTFNVTYSFDFQNGAYPQAAPTQGSDGLLYGTVTYGVGEYAYSGIYQVTHDGALQIIHTLDYFSEGDSPMAPLIEGSDGDFYGTCSAGGTNGTGTVFKTDSSGNLTVLYTFSSATFSSNVVSADGTYPIGPLAEGNDGNYYSTTTTGGANGYGTIFRVTSNGTFAVIHTLAQNDGSSPNGLTLGRDGNFYGTTFGGEISAAFRITPDGSFTGFGSQPSGPLNIIDPNAAFVQGSDGNFYSTTWSGGVEYAGTVFQLSLPSVSAAQLTILLSGHNVILTWPTNGPGFTLQCTRNLTLPANWNSVASVPVVVSGRYKVINPISGKEQFFRLTQ